MHALNSLLAARNETRQNKRQINRFLLRKIINIVPIVDIDDSELIRRYRFNKVTFFKLFTELKTLRNLKGSTEIPYT